MSPTLVLSDGKVEAAVGASGGPRICTLIVQVLLGMFGDGLPLQQALQAPRVHHQFKPDDIHIEEFVDPDIVRDLERRGYPVVIYPRLGIGAGIHRLSDDKLQATLDSRF
jgi:gamma-glutamyltranspeptidase/glutathione hydrolase